MEKENISPLDTNSEDQLVKPVDIVPEQESRLEKHKEKSARKNVLFVFGGILLLALFLFFFGVPLLVGFSTTLGLIQNDTSQPNTQEETVFIAPPLLDIPFESTRSAEITLQGSAPGDELSVDLYNNGNLIDSTAVKKDGSFVFQKVLLEKGGNIIKAKTTNEKDQESKFSESFVITYRDSAPEVEISSPSDGATFKKETSPLTVTGKTDSGENNVTINDFRAIVDADGAFSYRLPLHDGENKITVIATDDAGNEGKKEITIKVEN
ncbi:MAG: hypothetical protein AAB553_06670 [Patescibacteria group bacterium]